MNKAYERVTERIVELLEQGTCPWRRPWNKSRIRPQNGMTGHAYSGINLFLLEAMSFELPLFLTFKQVKQKGGNVKKGSKGFPVIYWSTFDKEDAEADEARKIPFLKYYTVFSASQIEGIDFPQPDNVQTIDFKPIDRAEEIAGGWQDAPEIKHGFNRACYIPAADEIHLPRPEVFRSAEDYYQTRFHEMGHATGHKNRLGRDMSGTFGDASYAKEELIAEMTAAFLCSDCGIDNSVIENEASYLAGWLSVIKGDPKLVVNAASHAQRAANLIKGAESHQKQEAAA